MFLVGTERKEKKSWLLNERKKKVIYINGALENGSQKTPTGCLDPLPVDQQELVARIE